MKEISVPLQRGQRIGLLSLHYVRSQQKVGSLQPEDPYQNQSM